MARCLPRNEKIKNKAESKVNEFIKDNFDDDFTLYHNREIKGKEFDFLLLAPNSTLYLLEVKGWRPVEIIKVHNTSKITYKDEYGIVKEYNNNPLAQIREYKFNLINYIKNNLKFEAKVIHLVCYPNIDEKGFIDTELNRISEREITILKEDFKDKESFLDRLYKAEELQNNKNMKLNNNQVYLIRKMFETDEEINYSTILQDKELNFYKDNSLLNLECKNKYSLLIYIKNNSKLFHKGLYRKLLEAWKSGCKIHFVSNSQVAISELQQYIRENLKYLSKYKDFEMKEWDLNTFNFTLYRYPKDDIEEDFYIIDGEDINNIDELQKIDRETSFNLNQFMLEHSEILQDIVVKAGAGSGKTFSMISRITFLIYKHRYSAKEISEKIVLITFTNEAANNMKERLKLYFMNYYLLTARKEAYLFVESINKMQISTIHSLVKKIINKFGTEVGLGLNPKITQGIVQQRKIVNKHIDEYMNDKFKGKDIVEVFGFRTFKLSEVIIELLNKIEGKNIYLDDSYKFGDNLGYAINDFISKRLMMIQKELLETALEENEIRLSQMIILLNKVIQNTEVFEEDRLAIDYLFVDEFQDTDDVQIELIKKFKEYINFNYFIVGDIKQCIYRFRGAEDDAFDKLISEKSNVKKFELYKNYRTDRHLLDIFHPIFSSWAELKYLRYKEEDRLVGVKTISCENKLMEIIESTEEEMENTLIKIIKNERNRLNLIAKEKGDKKKLAILVRNNSDVDQVKLWCDSNRIPIEANANGNLYELESTHDFYILLLALNNNKDPKCLFNIFETNYTVKKEDRTKLYNMNGNKDKMIEYFNSISPIENWGSYIEKLKKEPIMKVLREIIFNVKPWIIYSSRFNEEERKKEELYYKRNLEQLLENIINESSRDYITVEKLIESLRIKIFARVPSEIREKIVLDDGSNVSIQCLTIHKSKGLEYDTVILPFGERVINQSNPVGLVEVMVDKNIISYSVKIDN